LVLLKRRADFVRRFCFSLLTLSRRSSSFPVMKKLLLLFLAVGLISMVGCSKSDKVDTTATPQSTPDAARLKSDSERLQQATANAAKEREKAAQAAASPTPTATPQP
jgi:outer membrane murein-binding lipoprotein Lpp